MQRLGGLLFVMLVGCSSNDRGPSVQRDAAAIDALAFDADAASVEADAAEADAEIEDRGFADAGVDASTPDAGAPFEATRGARIAAGELHTCALTPRGTAKCWGQNGLGMLGDGTDVLRDRAVDVVGSTDAVAIVAGHHHSCALQRTGQVWCWGRNDLNQLGDQSLTDRYEPVEVVGLESDVVAIAAGTQHNCAALASGGVRCWGLGGGFGTGELQTLPYSRPPDPVIGAETLKIVQLSGGENFSCALTDQGAVFCWGVDDGVGKLGTDEPAFPGVARYEAAQVIGLSSGVRHLESGATATCAILENGGTQCWGLGYANFPITISGVSRPLDVFASFVGTGDTLFVTDQHEILFFYPSFPTIADDYDLSSLGDVVEIHGTLNHACAMMSAGNLKCWGSGDFGQLGNGQSPADIWNPYFEYAPVDVLDFP